MAIPKPFVSPHITLHEWQAGTKTNIDIFEDQVRGFVFNQIRALCAEQNPEREHAGCAILSLVTPYFEMVTAYEEGRASNSGETTRFLKRGLAQVLGSIATQEAIDSFVVHVRNGVFHELIFRAVLLHHRAPNFPTFGMMSAGANGLPQPPEPYDILVVDPWWLADIAESHFDGYVAKLRTLTATSDDGTLARFEAFIEVRKARR